MSGFENPEPGDKFTYRRPGFSAVTLMIEDRKGATLTVTTNGKNPTKVKKRDWPGFANGFNYTVDTPFKLVPRMTRPKCTRGVDWGSERVVIMKHGKQELQRVPGNSYSSGIGLRAYSETKYTLIDEEGNYGTARDVGGWGENAFVGHWSFEKLQKHAEEIAQRLGVSRSDVLRAGVVVSRRNNRDRTVVFDKVSTKGS